MFFPEKAIEAAKQLDEEFAKTGKPVGPLHGLPIALKVKLADYLFFIFQAVLTLISGSLRIHMTSPALLPPGDLLLMPPIVLNANPRLSEPFVKPAQCSSQRLRCLKPVCFSRQSATYLAEHSTPAISGSALEEVQEEMELSWH